ncbi:MAG: SPOR domain-containing protein [bacterium]
MEDNKDLNSPSEEHGLGEGNNGAITKGEKLKEGFRVQIYAGTDLIRAKKMETDIKQKVNLNVYLIYEPPQYKVRVGDFLSRAAAMSFCDSLRQTGFPDAWVVKSLVNFLR